jgi:hypothetical protein
MGYYINIDSNGKSLPSFLKGEELVMNGDAEPAVLNLESLLKSEPETAILIEVENHAWSALGFCYDENELRAFLNPSDRRYKRAYRMKRELAERLSGFVR